MKSGCLETTLPRHAHQQSERMISAQDVPVDRCDKNLRVLSALLELAASPGGRSAVLYARKWEEKKTEPDGLSFQGGMRRGKNLR